MMPTARETLYVLTIEAPPHLADAIGSHLFDVGLRALEEETVAAGVRLITYSDDRAQIEHYAATARAFIASLREFEPAAADIVVALTERPNDDWATSWMQYFKQTVLTPTLVVQPSWDDTPAPAGFGKLVIEPKMAFGFGTHATTQLAARAVERFCRAHPHCRVLDVGTGTGILALVALTHGAAAVEGTDIDPAAVDAAIENAQLNGLDDRCAFSTTAIHALPGPYDLVAANITAPTLIELAADLTRLTAPGGMLLLTGILSEYSREITTVYDERGMQLHYQEDQDEWRLLELKHE